MSLIVGDCRATLARWAAEGVRVQCVVTSPPYWGLRDYGVDGQLGLEATPEEYVANLVEVFRLVRDVLADDGTLWLNLGDSYNSGSQFNGHKTKDGASAINSTGAYAERLGDDWPGHRPLVSGLKPKDLCMIPARVAMALQADGWYLRSDIIWAKPNPMPESVTDRPTKAHEYLFLLSKRERYYYDVEAIREPWADERNGAPGGHRPAERNRGGRTDGYTTPPLTWTAPEGRNGRNRRSVWTIATAPFDGAHFAVFPPDLVTPCILAGSSAWGCCPRCGRQWERVRAHRPHDVTRQHYAALGAVGGHRGNNRAGGFYGALTSTTGWEPSCACGLEPVPSRVLDPFMGSGTVAMVAQDLGRAWLGCELSDAYAALCAQRTRQAGLVLR